MGEKTLIAWADHTFNPWIGCTKISTACDNCYAEKWSARFDGAGTHWGAGKSRRRTSAANWKLPLRWNRQAEINFKSWERFQSDNGLSDDEMIEQHGFIKPRRPRVFCASLADVFDNEVPDSWRFDLFQLIGQTPYLDWLLLTKRIGNVRRMCQHDGLAFDLIGDGRCWLGITVCNQEEADRDIPKLLKIPAAKRFLSIEPLLERVDLRFTNGLVHGCDAADYGVDWVIVGGESGHNARPLHPEWVRSLRDQCAEAGVPFFFKQWRGDKTPGDVLLDGVRHQQVLESRHE